MFSGGGKARGGESSYPFISVQNDWPAALAPCVRYRSMSIKARSRWYVASSRRMVEGAS